MSEGHVILINGTSSAGKTSLANALQTLSSSAYQIVSLDQFRDGLPDRFRGLNSSTEQPGARGLNVVAKQFNGKTLAEIRFGDYGQRVLTGMRHSIVTLAKLGINVIVDDLVNYRLAAEEYARLLKPFETTIVGVHCELAELYRREQRREGRFPGTAEAMLLSVHEWMHYDINVDTDNISIHDEAELVLREMERPKKPRAIDLMAQDLL